MSWHAKAYAICHNLAKSGQVFTSDDVWRQLPKPKEPRALGGVLRSLSEDGAIRLVGYRRTTQATRHRAPVAMWRGAV